MDTWVRLVEGTIAHSKKVDSPKQSAERYRTMLVDFANMLDQNERCLACLRWGQPDDMEPDVNGYLCKECAQEESGNVE